MNTLSILNGKGDTKLTWDAADPEQCREARATVAELKRAGYSRIGFRFDEVVGAIFLHIAAIQCPCLTREFLILSNYLRLQHPSALSPSISPSSFVGICAFCLLCVRNPSAILDGTQFQDNLSLTAFDSQIGQKSRNSSACMYVI